MAAQEAHKASNFMQYGTVCFGEGALPSLSSRTH